MNKKRHCFFIRFIRISYKIKGIEESEINGAKISEDEEKKLY